EPETLRVELYSELLHRHGYDPLPHHSGTTLDSKDGKSDYPFTLTSAKNGYVCHSQHRSVPSLRKRSPDPEAVLNASVAADKGIRQGDWVRITTPLGSARFVATLDKHLSEDVV